MPETLRNLQSEDNRDSIKLHFPNCKVAVSGTHVRSAKVGLNGSRFIPALVLVVMRSNYISALGSVIGCAGKRG